MSNLNIQAPATTSKDAKDKAYVIIKDFDPDMSKPSHARKQISIRVGDRGKVFADPTDGWVNVGVTNPDPSKQKQG